MSSKKAREENGEFVIEGMRNCTDAAAEQKASGRVEITAVYYTARAMEKYSAALPTELLTGLDDSIKYELSPDLAEKLADSENGQGVFVTAKRLDKIFCADTIISDGKYLVVDNIQDPGNLGTLIRTADAVGVSGVILTGNCCDLYNPKVVRAAMGSIARVDVFIDNDFEKVVSVFGKAGIVNVASVISGGTDITSFDFDRPCAVYIGNEGRGMPPEHIAACDEKITIAMKGRINSLNAGAAATIILWEMFR